MTKQRIVEQFQGLTTDDKVELLDELWRDLAADLQDRPISDAERRFLDQRLADINADSRESRPWAEVRDELLRRQ